MKCARDTYLSKTSRSDERGSILLLALMITVFVTMLAMVAANDASRRLTARHTSTNASTALVYAQAGLENAARLASETTSWRTALDNQTWIASKRLGEGRIGVRAADPSDGDLGIDGSGGSSDADTVRLTSTGNSKDFTRTLEADYVPTVSEAMKYLVFTPDKIELDRVELEGRVRGGDDVVDLGGTSLVGDITTLTGKTVSVSLDDADTDVFYADTVMTLPVIDFQWFVDAGEKITLPHHRWISNTRISPTFNPYGTASPNGIYWIDAGGNDVGLRNVAVNACIAVVNVGQVRIYDPFGGDATLYYHRSPDPDRLPAMVVDGGIDWQIEGGGAWMIDLGEGTETITCGLHGLFYCTGSFLGPQRDATTPINVEGALLAGGTMRIEGPGTFFRHLTDLNTSPLIALTGNGLRIVPGTTREP